MFKKLREWFERTIQKKPTFNKSLLFFDNEEQEQSYLDVAERTLQDLASEGLISTETWRGMLAYIYIARDTASRCSEILNIKIDDIDLGNPEKGYALICNIKDKKGAIWHKPLGKKATEMLEKYLDTWYRIHSSDIKLLFPDPFSKNLVWHLFEEVNHAWHEKFGIVKGDPRVKTECPVKIRTGFFRHNLLIKAALIHVPLEILAKIAGYTDLNALLETQQDLTEARIFNAFRDIMKKKEEGS